MMYLSVTHLNALAQRCHATAVEHGFWDDREQPSDTAGLLSVAALRISALGRDIEAIRKGQLQSLAAWPKTLERHCTVQQIVTLSKLVLIVSEVVEAIDAVLHGIDNLDEELADILIRTLDLAQGCGFDIGLATVKKMTLNDARPRMHNRLA